MFHDEPVVPAVSVHHAQKSRDVLTERYQLHRVVNFLLDTDTPYQRVALQLPDEMLEDSVVVVALLEELVREDDRYNAMQAKIDARLASEAQQDVSDEAPRKRLAAAASPLPNPHRPTTIRFFVLSDTTFGSCCPDEVTAQHYQSDCIIHFGEACMSRSTRLPVFYVHQPFAFNCLVGVAEMPHAAVHLIHNVVRRMAEALRQRQRHWCEEHADVALEPRVVVVGTHQNRELINKAAAAWRAEDAAATAAHNMVDWCGFEERNGGTPASSDDLYKSSPAGDDMSDSWVVNGVRFPRVTSPTSTAQFFLFVGPADAPHLLHLFAVQQYNRVHLVPEVADFLSSANDDGPLEVSLLSGAFAEGVRHPESALSVTLLVDELVQQALQPTGTRGLYSNACAAAQVLLQRRLRQRDYNIEAVRASSSIGILVASLAVEGYYEMTMLLHRLIRLSGKRSYIIFIGKLNEFKLANFVDTVDCFVAVACPNSRASHFPQKSDGYLKPVVAPSEVLLALSSEEATPSAYGMPAAYSTAFEYTLPPLRAAVSAGLAEEATEDGGQAARTAREDAWGASAALIRSSTGALTSLGARGSLARLHERSYVGLDPRIGQTAVQDSIADGLHGIARGYAAEREVNRSHTGAAEANADH